MQRSSGFRTPLAAALLTILAALLFSASANAARCADVHATPADNPRAAHRATLCLLNQERAAHGLRPLRSNDALATAARGHSRDMVRRSFFDHTAPGNVTFVDRIRRANYSPRGAWAVGENLAWGSGSLSDPASIVRGWLNSPGHRANILNGRFRSIGLGIARGVPVDASAAMARSGATYTTDFGSR